MTKAVKKSKGGRRRCGPTTSQSPVPREMVEYITASLGPTADDVYVIDGPSATRTPRGRRWPRRSRASHAPRPPSRGAFAVVKEQLQENGGRKAS